MAYVGSVYVFGPHLWGLKKNRQKEEASERMLNEIEAGQLLAIEFKAVVIRKRNELTENYQKLQGNYNELTANYINNKRK